MNIKEDHTLIDFLESRQGHTKKNLHKSVEAIRVK